jgi:hypothetical protein
LGLVCLHQISISSSKNIILWQSQKLNKLDPKNFKWDQGGAASSNYSIKDGSVLKITAAPRTDHNKNNFPRLKQSPRVIFPIPECHRNFEASVQVKFKSNTNHQRAVFGISDPQMNKHLYIYSRENSLEESSVEAGMDSLSYSSSKSYNNEKFISLKIKNVSGFVDLLYSADNSEWKRLEWKGLNLPILTRFPDGCELYFEVLSTDLSEEASGEFINFSYKPE